MWNPFRRKADDKPFPKPEWPPIQALDRIDIIGQRRDGGLDLVIVASQPIDDSLEILDNIRQKVRTYLTAIAQEDFQAEMGYPPRDKTAIIIACDHPIHPKAQAVIDECRARVAAEGVRLEMEKST